MIIAVDVAPKRLELALELGATHVINSREADPVATIRELAPGGADFSIESSGRPAVLRQAVDALGKCGTCGIVGAAPIGSEVSFDINHIMVGERSILGIIEGNSVPQVFIPPDTIRTRDLCLRRAALNDKSQVALYAATRWSIGPLVQPDRQSRASESSA
jgi:Zn-dependent alcohol dehydrogenase